MSGFKTDNNSGDIYYDDVEYTVRKVKKAKISTAAGTNPGTVDINLSYQNTPGSNDYTVDSKISLVPGDGLSFSQNSGDGTITLIGTPKNNLAAAQDPTRTDDNTQGYATGSFWVNTSSDISGTKKNKAFLCTSALTGNAVWTTIDKMTVKSAAPTANNDGGSPDGTNADRGYAIGSFWLDITTQTDPKLYVCVSNAVNGASWKEVGSSSGPQLYVKTVNPLNSDPEANNAPIGSLWINKNWYVSFIKVESGYWRSNNIRISSSGPGSNTEFPTGSLWADIVGNIIYMWDGTEWFSLGGLPVVKDANDPTSSNKKEEGTIWINTTNDTAFISTYKGSASPTTYDAVWVSVGGGGLNPIVSANAPTTANKEPEGTLWVESDTDKAWISVDQAAGTWKLIADGLPAGNHTEVQFNKNNEFGASSNLVYTDWEEKGGALKQKYDNTSNAYNYYNYRTALTSGGRAHFYSYHMPSSIYTSTGTLNAYHGIHLVDASSTSPIILTLPGAGITESAITGTTGLPSLVPFGYIIKIKRIDIGSSSLSNIVLIRAPVGYLIDGFDGIDLPLQQRESVTLYLSADHPTAGIKNWLIL